MEIQPYYIHDGIPSMLDSYIASLYDRMVEEGTDKTIFISGPITRDEFLNAMKNEHLLVVTDNDNPIAFCSLTELQEKTARFHFCFFKEARGKRSIDVSKFILDEVMKIGFDMLIGYIPDRNIPAINLFKKLGVTFAGVLPKGVWNHTTQESESCSIVYWMRG